MKELRDGQPLEHAVIRRPIVVLAPRGGESARDGMSSEIEQAGEELGAHALIILRGGEGLGRARQELVQMFAQ